MPCSSIALLKHSDETATKIISEHQTQILQLVQELESHEVLDFEQIEACLTSDSKIFEAQGYLSGLVIDESEALPSSSAYASARNVGGIRRGFCTGK